MWLSLLSKGLWSLHFSGSRRTQFDLYTGTRSTLLACLRNELTRADHTKLGDLHAKRGHCVPFPNDPTSFGIPAIARFSATCIYLSIRIHPLPL